MTAPGPQPLPEAAAAPAIQLHGLKLHAITEAQCVEHVVAASRAGRGGWVITPNLDHLRRHQRDPEFRALCSQATLLVADGMPLIWAASLQRTPLPERVAGSNLIWSLNRAAAEHGLSVFLLGGDPGTAEAAAEVLRQRTPSLRVAGTHCPPPGFEKDPEQMSALREAIAGSRPHIVFVALGSPKQERLIGELRTNWPQIWWLGVGISFSFVSGHVRRAPPWMRSLGIEWLHRLCQDPKRLFQRYVVHGIPFALKILCGSGWQGLTGSARRVRASAKDDDLRTPA